MDELPFDFQRRRMSVVVDYEEDHVLICKGAVEEIYACCSHYQIEDEVYPLIDMIRADLFEEVEKLNRDGFRVLGIAYREFPRSTRPFSRSMMKANSSCSAISPSSIRPKSPPRRRLSFWQKPE